MGRLVAALRPGMVVRPVDHPCNLFSYKFAQGKRLQNPLGVILRRYYILKIACKQCKG